MFDWTIFVERYGKTNANWLFFTVKQNFEFIHIFF